MIRFTTGNQTVSKSRPRPQRSGMILAVVLVALLVVMLLGAALVNAFVARRQFVRHREQQQQAFWLAESALNRAAHRFANEQDYEGETWHVSADLLGGTHAGVAVVRVESAAEGEAGSRIIVDATYPQNALKKIVEHREHLATRTTELTR